MAMRPPLGFALSGLLGGATVLGIQQVTQTFVVNLKDPHPVEGVVDVTRPIPHSDVQSFFDVVVPPASRAEPGLWSDVGVIDTEGFTSAVLSLHGQLRGDTGREGAVVVVLVPEEENILRALGEGEVHLALEAEASPVPSGGLYFSGTRAGLPIAFPRYRAFVYNTTDRSASVNLFAYLTH